MHGTGNGFKVAHVRAALTEVTTTAVNRKVCLLARFYLNVATYFNVNRIPATNLLAQQKIP
jgi:hypothetical protein